MPKLPVILLSVLSVFAAPSVEVLKQQAEARKTFYSEQAKAQSEQKERHATEKQELLARHRAARAEFGKQPHTPVERMDFYKLQRHEMNDLVIRQKNEKRMLKGELDQKRDEFHRDQKQALTKNQ